MANNLDAQEVTQNTNGNYIQHNTGLAQAIAALTGAAALTVTDANIDLTTGGAQDVTSQKYKALRNLVFLCTGTMTGNRQVIVPTNKKVYCVSHACAGGFTITVKTPSGTGVDLVSGNFFILYCDGTNVVLISGGGGAGGSVPDFGSGAPSAGTVDYPGHLYVDTTNNRLYFGVSPGGNFIDVGTLGHAYNQISDGTNSADATGSETLKFEASVNIGTTVTPGSPDKVVHKIALSGQAAGDILYFNGTDWVRLAKGSDGQVLTLVSGLPAWV